MLYCTDYLLGSVGNVLSGHKILLLAVLFKYISVKVYQKGKHVLTELRKCISFD